MRISRNARKGWKGRPCRAGATVCKEEPKQREQLEGLRAQSRQGTVFAPGVGSAPLSVGAGQETRLPTSLRAGWDLPSCASVSTSVKWDIQRVVLPPACGGGVSTQQDSPRTESVTAQGTSVTAGATAAITLASAGFLKLSAFIQM